MKHRWSRMLALLLALTLAVVTIALAEEKAATGDGDDDSIEVVESEQDFVSTDIEPGVEEVGGLLLGDLMDSTAGEEPAGEDAPEDMDWNGVQTWWFFVGEGVVASQEAREGDEIRQPEEPAAPEGMIFDGWFLGDGARLFADDAKVIANPDPQTPDVYVYARFVEAEEPAEKQETEEPAGEEPAGDEPGTEEPAGDTEQEGDTTSSDPADAEPASPEGEATEPTEPEEPSPEGQGEEEGGQEPVSGEDGSADPQDDGEQSEAEEVPAPTANELTYTGEAQALVSAEPGAYLYSLDGEGYSEEIPTAVNAGEYTVYFVPADDAEAEAQALTVVVAKADVVFTPPEAATGEE